MELSKRLYAVAGLVTEGASVADIGTDHGYIPIYLAGENKARRLIAMDVNQDPLERAREHIREHHMEERIETRLSDGLAMLEPGEVDTVIAAGMGGSLVIHILESFPEVTGSIREFILQPQSDIEKVRRWLDETGFEIIREDMVQEDGKYYPMMKAVHRGEGIPPAECSKIEFLYGKLLLKNRNPVLFEFLLREKRIKEQIREQLQHAKGDRARKRRGELESELRDIERALKQYER